MKVTRLTQRVLLALVCSLAIISLPLSAGAQRSLFKKGTQGYRRGSRQGLRKPRKSAEAVGHGVKKAVTGEDTSDSRMKSTAPSQTTAPSTRSQTTRPSHTKPWQSARPPQGQMGNTFLLQPVSFL